MQPAMQIIHADKLFYYFSPSVIIIIILFTFLCTALFAATRYFSCSKGGRQVAIVKFK